MFDQLPVRGAPKKIRRRSHRDPPRRAASLHPAWGRGHAALSLRLLPISPGPLTCRQPAERNGGDVVGPILTLGRRLDGAPVDRLKTTRPENRMLVAAAGKVPRWNRRNGST